MSASAICDAFIVLLSSTSAFGPGCVATSYGVLESSSGSAVVVQWSGLNSRKDQFGQGTTQRDWTIALDMYVKDTGDPIAVSNRIQSCIDILVATVESDDTIQGTCKWTGVIRSDRNLPADGGIFTAGGFDWVRMLAEADVVEWPNG